MERRVDGPRFIRPDEFDDTIALVRSCFGGRFRDPDQPPPHWVDPADQERHAVIVVDGDVVSHAVCAPIEFIAGPATVPARGIAGVATHPDHRGNGYMSQLFEFWIEHTTDAAVPLLELEGDRQRYMRLGWDNAGSEFRFTITSRSLPSEGDRDAAIRPFRSTGDDLERIAAVHDAERYRVRRDRDAYARLLDPHRYDTLVYDDGHVFAYVCHRGSDPVSVEEFGGNRAGVRALLQSLCARDETLHAYTHPKHPLVELFYEISADWALRSHRKLRINDLIALLTAYRPQIEDRWREYDTQAAAEVTLKIDGDGPVSMQFDERGVEIEQVDGGADIVLDRPAMTRLLFGVAEGMWSIKRAVPVLAAVLPLPYYMWEIETI